MGIVGNYSVLNKTPGRALAGSTAAYASGISGNGPSGTRAAWNRNSDWRKFNWVDQCGGSNVSLVKTAAKPRGYYPPGAYALPGTAGEFSTRITGTGTVSALALAVKLAEADLTGTGTITDANASRIVQLLAALTGTGTITDANLQAFLQAVAALSGSGGVSSGVLSGLGALLAALTGTGTATGSTLTGTGALDADITVTGTGLTTSNVGPAVWSALAAANNDPGTMGEKLNDAGSASNPWTEVIESGYTAAEILKLIAAAVQGNASGLESGAPTFKGLDGTTDRITATYASGTRTVTGRDVT